MTDRRLEVVTDLIQVTRASLTALAGGSLDLAAFEAPRETLFQSLQQLDSEHPGPVPAALRPHLERLQNLNAELLQAVEAALVETQNRLQSVTKGRRGLSGYLGAAVGGRQAGAKLGRG